MSEEIKKALEEFLEAHKETDRLCHFGELEPNKSIYYYVNGDGSL